MNAALVQSYDAPPAYATFQDPIPEAGEHLVTVTAAALHRIVKALANGSHYGSTGQLPFIPGVDGVGRLQSPAGTIPSGARVYFGVTRSPFGTFAEQAPSPAFLLIPLPDNLPDATAAAIANPAMSSWVALDRAQFTPGESVLILGATGVSGQLAVQIARRRGASRIVAAGRNPEALAKLPSLGADAVISLDQPTDALISAFRSELDAGIHIVLDYLWGSPAEALLAAIARKGLSHASPRIRYVDIGNTAGPNITLPAATLRSSGLELLGSGFGSASMDHILRAVASFFALTAADPFQFALQTAPLSDVSALWNETGQATRLVFVP
jgi:NADPH2:quinone reductase